VEEKSFVDSLHDLVLFCSEHDAINWREIWRTWKYSEAVEFALHLAKRKAEQRQQLEGIENPLAFVMTLLIQRLK
jgi:hypothetical protein